MSNGNTVSRILSQLVDAEKRNEIESPTARVARARQETQELHQRINRLSTYNRDNVRDYTEDDTQSNGLFEFGKMVKDNTVRTVRGLDQSRRRFDVSQNTETYNFSPEQRNVEDLLTSGKQNQEKMNYLREAIKEAEAKGQTETANFYKQELIQTQRLKTLYGLTPSEASIADSPVTNANTANQINEGMAKYGRGGFSRKENQIESLQDTSLSQYVDKNAARLDLGQVYEGLAAKRASQDNFQAIRDRQKTFAGEDGEQGADSFINSIKALGENPDSIAYNAGQLLPYMVPGVGTLQFLADMDNFANTTENNAYADTGRGIRSDEERDRAAIAYGLNIPISYLDRLLGKAATGGAGVGGKITGAISAPISKANEKIIAGLAGNKSQALYKGTSKALGATTKAGLIAGADTGTEILQEGSQTFLEQVGSNRKVDLAEISEAAAIGGGVGGAASLSGAAAKGIKYASGKGINKVKEKVAESRAPMNDDEYLDSNSKKYSPVSVVEDANKALSTGNASRESIKKSKARIANAKKSVNKEIQELERIVSLKTKQQQLVEQFKDADSISDSDMKTIEDNAEAIQNLPYSIKLDVAQERLTAAREAKIAMEAEVSRAEAKVAKESKRSTNVAKATKIQELLTEQESNRSRIEEIDAKLADTNISDTEASTLENEKLEIQNSAMKTATQISKLDPDGLISEIEASKKDTTITPKNIKEKLSGILKSPEVTANVSKKAELEELGRKLDSVTVQQNALKKTDSVKGDIVEGGIEGDRKYIGTKEHLSNSIKAVDNNDNKAYNNQMRMLENFEASHTSKAKAMNDASAAFNETGKTQLVYREEGKLTWTFAPKTFFGKNSTRDKKKFGALEVHEKSGRLIKTIEDEANHIKETREFIEEYKAKVANSDSTSAKGKNVNGKTSNNSNATGSTNTDSNKSKKIKSNKPKVNPVKNKNKNMITSWKQKKNNTGETNVQHDSITELHEEKNKGLKGKPVNELVLRDDERHAYNALSYLANKTIIAPNVNDNNVVWESFAEDAFGENTNAGNYSKDDVVMLVMPQTVTDFNALVPELNKALAAGAEVVYMNPRHTNNEVTKDLITNNLVAVVKAKGYTLVKDKSQNKINLNTKVEIFKAVKEETGTNSNTDTQFNYDKSTWTNGNEKGEPLHSKQLKELEEQDTVNLKEGDLENAEVLRPTGKLITNEKAARIELAGTTYLYNKDGITNLDGSKVPDRVQKAYDKTQENDPAFYDTEKGQELYGDFRGITYDQIDEDGTVHNYKLTFSIKDGRWNARWEMFFPDLGKNGRWGLINENKKNPESADYEFMLTNFMTVAEDPVNIKHFVGTDSNRKARRLKAEYDLLGSSDNNSNTNTDVKLSVSNDEVIKRGWNNKKIEGVPNYEVSSNKGDRRFSALYAILKDGRSIEEAYQLDVKGYREIAEKQGYKRGNKIPGKGKTFITSMTEEEGYQAYKNLWETYLKENPELAEVLIKQINAGSILTDSFARTVNNQARALAEITKESIANSSTGTKTVAEYKEDWKKISEGALKSKWQEDYLNKYSRNKDKGEDYLKSLFPNATKDKEGNYSKSKWDAFVEFVEESNAASINTVTSSKSGLVHTVPELLINKTYVMAKQLEAIKEVTSGLLDSDTEAYTTGLRDVFLDIIVDSKLPVGLTLLTDPKKIAAIERRKGNGEFIADAWIRGKNTEVRINLNNSFKDVDVKTILTHELSHIVTIAAVNKVSDTNSPLDNRLKSAITVLTNWLDNNKDTLDVKTFNSLTYSLIDSKEFVAVNTTQEEAINQLINIPFGESNLYQEVVAITIEAMKETYGNKITPQIEERINVLSSEYETKRREIQGNNEAVSTDDGTSENGVGETGGSSTSTGDQQLSGPTSREGQTDDLLGKLVLTTTNSFTSKDQKKADQANAYIGFADTGSTKQYFDDAIEQGFPTNEGIVANEDTIAFVSINGKGKLTDDNYNNTLEQVIRVLEAGGQIVVDNDYHAFDPKRSYNVGEKRLQTELRSKNYNVVNNKDFNTYSKANENEESNVRNTVTATENEVTQGNETLLSQDEDIFTSVVLARDWKRISEQAGIEIEDNNIRQLEAYIEFHETITKGIEKLIDKRDAPSNLNNALFKYLAVTDDTGKIYLPKNVVAAISLSAFKFIQTEGKKLKLTDAQLLAVHGLDAYTRLYPQAKYKLSELGGHKEYMSQDMGKLAYAALDLSIGDNARVNTKQELEASLGSVVYTLLKINTDLIKEQPPMKHRDQLIRLVQSMPMGQAKDLVASKTTIDVNTIKNKEGLVKALKDSKDSYLEASITLARINNSYDKKTKEISIPEEGAKVINGSTKNPGQTDLLDKLFSVPRERTEPHDKAPKFTQETAKESRSLITKEAAKALNEIASYEWGIEGAKADLMIQLFDTDKDSFYSLIGLSSDAEINNLHSEIRETELIETITRRNLLDEQIEWLKSRRNEDGTYKPFYQLPVVWQNSRFGYESTLFNAQTDIFARMLTNLKGWKATVETSKDAPLINDDGTVSKEGLFHLALAEKIEGVSSVFGDKFVDMNYDPDANTPDKVGPQDYLPEFVNYLENNTEFKQAVSAMRDLLAGETLTGAKLDTLKSFTKLAKTGELALGMLVEYISFQDARDAGETYTTYMSLQSDGITNGPAITDILFGVFTDEKLLKAGIIPESFKDTFSNFYETKKAGYTDKYQDTGMDMKTVMFTYMPKGTSITELLSTVDDKFGSRSWAKKLVTPFNYGSGTKAMKRNIAGGFVDKVVGDYHSLYNMENKKERDALINQLNTLLSTASDIARNLKTHKPVSNRDALVEIAYLHNNNTNDITKQIFLSAPDLLLEIMEKTPKFIQTKNEGKSRAEIVYAYSTFLRNNFEAHKFEKITDKNADDNFSFSNRELLESLVDISFGTASAKAINTTEAASVAYRQDLTDVTVRAVEMEKFAEDILIDNFIPDSQLPDGLDMSQYDSPLDAKRVYMTVGQKKLIDKEMDKHRATMHSGLSAKYNASRDSGIVVAKEGLANIFGEQIKFGNPLRTEETSNTQGPSITFTYGYSYKTTSSPGVSAGAMSVQSLDAAIATETVSKFKSMNLHDAASFSILDYTDGVRKQNQEFYDAVTTYDIGKEALESYLAPLRLLRSLLDNESISDKSKQEINNFIHNEVEGKRVHEKTKQEIGGVKIVDSLKSYSATKIAKLNTIHTVQQYGGVDGQVVVDKVDTSNMLSDIESTIKEAVNLIEGRETKPVEEVTLIQDVNTSELESSISTNKLSLTGLIGVLNKALPDSNGTEILNSLNDTNLTKVKVKVTKKRMSEDVKFSKLDNTLYIVESAFQWTTSNQLIRDIQRGALEAALHNNLKAVKNGSTNIGTLTDSYRGMQLLVNALPSMVERAAKELVPGTESTYLISHAEKNTLLNALRGDRGKGVERIIANILADENFVYILKKVPNYTDIDSKDIKRGNIFSKIKEFIIDLVTNGFDSPNRESIYNLLTATSNEIVSELQEARGLETINGLINQSMIVNQNQDSVNLYDYEYDNALLNGYDTQFHLEIAKMAMNQGSAVFDTDTILSLAHKLLSDTPYDNDGYNQTLIPVIEMLQKYLGTGNKATKVIMVQDRDSIDSITKDEWLTNKIGNIIESGRSLFTMIGDNRYVFLSNAMVSSSADTKIATVIHELLHAFTAETLNDPKNKSIKKRFEQLRMEAYKDISQEALDNNYQLEYALRLGLPIDEFVVQVLTVPSVRRAIENLYDTSLVRNEAKNKEPEMFSEMASLFGYERESKEATILNNFSKMFGKLVFNNTTSRNSEEEINSAVLGSREAYKTARVKQALIDIGHLDNIDQISKAIAEETKDLNNNNITELEFIKQKAAENNNAELLDDIAVHEQQVYSQRVLKSPEITFTPKEVRTRIQENDVSESTNREYLNVIENSILTPLDYLIDDALIKGFRPETIWHDAVVNGENLTVSNAYDVGFELNNEQGYMLETLESILSKVIDKVNNTAAYRQMESVYTSAKDALVASDFHDGDWDNATQEEKQIAREKLTYLFRPQDSGPDGKSNYLVRFAALSMVSPEIQSILSFKANSEIVGDTWFEKATSLFSEAIEIVDGGFSGVSGKGNLNDRITDLALSMAKTYAKENDKLSDFENNVANKLESVTEMFSDTLIGAAKEAGIKLTDTDLAQSYPIGRLTNKALKGELDRFQEYADFFMDYVGKNSPLGTMRETINETLTDTSKDQELATDSFNAIKVIEVMRGKAIDAVRRNILDSFSKENKKMSKEDTKAVSNLLRADIQSLRELGLTHSELMDIVTNRNTRNQKAKELLDTLPVDLRNELQSRGDNLGYYLVKGVARKPLLAKNAFAILSRVGMGKGINTNFTQDHVKNLDALITIYALNYSDTDTLNRVADINSKESGDINGLEHSILSHQKFTRESDALFMDNPFSKQKGYIPSIYNTDRGFAIVKRSEVEDYKELGYKENSTLETALHEDEMTNKEDMVFMTLSNTGKQSYVSGAFSIDSPGAKGSSVEFDSDKFVKIAERQRASIDTVSQTNMIPIYDTDGNIRGYRYEMGNTAKDSYLDRNNDFPTLLAQFKGANITKENFPDSNKKLVDALIDKARNMKENEINSYILISPDSSSKRAREFWAMLPKETRMYIENQTGEKGILVKKKELNLLIGYRKYNPSDAFTKEYSDKNIAELVYTSIFEAISGKKAKLRFDQGFKPLLEMVGALKNFIVIRGIKVLIANIKSNIALLMINGFTPIQSTRDIKDALVYSIRYQKQASELLQLEHEISLGYGNTNKISRMTELKNSIARNPLKAFIEEGMMPMIVNDFSFKKGEVEYNTFIDDVKDATVNKLPAPLRKTVDFLMVAEGTHIHNFLANATQQSDFVFKYAIHQQEMRKGKTNKEAIARAREVFINYDVPTNRFIQFLNDTGLWMFTKFALRIQRVILRLLKEKPLRLATEALVSEQLGNPSIISLNLISAAGGGGGLRNPMTNVLSMYEHALPIQLLTSVFK